MGLVDGYLLTVSDHGIDGRICRVKTISRTAQAQVRRVMDSSLEVKGAKLFKMLLLEIRNISSGKVNVFKRA